MTPLERFTALTPTHYEVLDAVEAIEREWGIGAPLTKVAWRVSVSPLVAEACLIDLALVGLVTWCVATGEAFGEESLPVLGSVA